MDYNVQFKMLDLYALKAQEQQKKSQKTDIFLSLYN